MNLVSSVNKLNETERIRKVEEIATMLANFTAVQDQPVYAAEIDIAVNIVSSLNRYCLTNIKKIFMITCEYSVTSTVVNKLSPDDMFFEVKQYM